MIVIIPDGDIIVTSLTLNGCVSLWHRATPVAKPRPGILFYCVAPKQSCQHPKECFPLFHRQLRATFTRPSNQFRAPLSPHPSIGGKKEKNQEWGKASYCSSQIFSIKPRYSTIFFFLFFHCSPISSIFSYTSNEFWRIIVKVEKVEEYFRIRWSNLTFLFFILNIGLLGNWDISDFFWYLSLLYRE